MAREYQRARRTRWSRSRWSKWRTKFDTGLTFDLAIEMKGKLVDSHFIHQNVLRDMNINDNTLIGLSDKLDARIWWPI